MFFAAIHFPPSPFVRRFAGLKFLPAFARMSVPKSMHMSAPMSLKIFAPRFALKSAAAFLPKFAKTSSQSFSQMFIPALVRRSAQHFAPAARRSLPRCRKFLPARRPQAFSLNRCNRALSPSPRNPWRPLPRLLQRNRNSLLVPPRSRIKKSCASSPAIPFGGWHNKISAAAIAGRNCSPQIGGLPTPTGSALAQDFTFPPPLPFRRQLAMPPAAPLAEVPLL